MDDLEEMAKRIIMIAGGKMAFDGSFKNLREITGNQTNITVTTTGINPPVLKNGTLLHGENGFFEYEIDLSKTSVKELLYELSQFDGIQDVEILKSPIETVITKLYHQWQ